MPSVESTIRHIRDVLCGCSCIEAMVLGGSRAVGMADEHSDIDIGIYYDKEKLDYDELNRVAALLDDAGRSHVLCREGEWGPWVNCGAWLTSGGRSVDIIMRDMNRVHAAVNGTDSGAWAAHYQTGHPHAYLDVAYRGELASCRVLYTRNTDFLALKKHAEWYPPALKASLIRFFGFEADFSCMLAEKSLPQEDGYYTTGHVFRSVSALNQALFALNEAWCLNEKKAIFRIDRFPRAPMGYAGRVHGVFKNLLSRPAESLADLKSLCNEAKALWEATDQRL